MVEWRKGFGKADGIGLSGIFIVGILLSSLFWLAMTSATHGGLAPPVDDTFIYFQYARNIAEGHPFSYFPGDPPTTGATGFLYPFLLAPGFLMGLDGNSIIIYAYVMSALFLLGTATLVYLLVRQLADRYLAVLGGLLTVMSGPILWGFFSLMEIGLVSLVLMLVVYLFVRESNNVLPWRTLLGASLLPLCRPEGLLMTAFIMLLVGMRLAPFILQRLRLWPGVAPAVSRPTGFDALPNHNGIGWVAGLALMIPVGVSVGYLMFLRGLTGSFSTNTYLSKAISPVPQVPWFDEVGMVANNAATLLQDPFGLTPTYLPILLFPVMAFGLAWGLGLEVRERKPGIGVLGLGLFLILVLSVSQLPSVFVHHLRYIMAIYPLVLVFAMVGLGVLGQFFPEGRFLCLGLGLLLLALVAVTTPKWSQTYAENTSDIYFQQVSLARWVNDNIPEGSTIAINDAGAMAYHGGHRVYDMVGLVTNDASLPFRHGTGAVYERIRSLNPQERPEYYAIYPDWFAFPSGEFLTEIFRTKLLRLSISSAPVVVVYRADYSVAEDSHRPVLDHEEGSRWEIVDSLNVADLEDEARHNYRQIDLIPRGPVPVTVLQEWQYSGGSRKRLLDGGRIILGAEEFTVVTQPGLPLKLVMRTDAFQPITLRVYADGRYAGEWSYAQHGGTWVEPSFVIPGVLLQAETTRVRLELKGYALTSTDYAPFHYWFYQPTGFEALRGR